MHKGDPKFTSVFGGGISLISKIAILIYSLIILTQTVRRKNYSIKTREENIDVQFENQSVNLNSNNFDISFLLLKNDKPLKMKNIEQYLNVRFI